ncbi:TAXI family TRAP transporter solute-binding subunit [Alkalihalobacillus sp. BA299]|uniref:TAXI family TRAP transporter solute-binding subunit n=1 Tax=Alkalihalobacillus sp. BA299 TaxID=2815938 RepID=UPI001ADC2860|nr:TAXI family TRAP transporter solute-binding subunit [Alkalihalobacillus sp. BA299]
MFGIFKQRNRILLALLALVTIFFISACSSDNSSSSEGSNQPDNDNGSNSQPLNFSVGGSTSGSTAFAYSIAIGNIMGTHTDNMNLQIQETSGTVDGVRQLYDGGIDIAVSVASTTIDAREAVGPFETLEPFDDLRMMWNMYPTPFNMVVTQDSGIDTPKDIAGKTIGAGAPGSSSYIMLIELLKAYDISEDDVDIRAMTPEEQDTAFRDGHIDVMTFQAGPGTAWLMDLSRSRDLKWLEMTDESFDKMASKKAPGYYVLSEIPGGSYEGLEESIQVVATNVEWVTTKDLDEETVYNITKTFWENKEEADEMHSIIPTSTLEVAFGSATAPWHPGVIRYLEEKGIDYAPYE